MYCTILPLSCILSSLLNEKFPVFWRIIIDEKGSTVMYFPTLTEISILLSFFKNLGMFPGFEKYLQTKIEMLAEVFFPKNSRS